jgi:uncharacterized membrane protein YqjE
MSPEVQNPNEQSLTTLVGGIVHDLQDLIKQQVQLTRQEIGEDFRKLREAASLLVVGLMLIIPGVLTLCLMLAHLIHWLAYKPDQVDPAYIPLWVCYLIASAVFLIGGGALAYLGKQRMDAIRVAPQTTQALQENMEWRTNR